MKFIHLSLMLALGTTPALLGSGSSAKKRKNVGQDGAYKADDQSREDGSDAKKSRKSSDESDTKAAASAPSSASAAASDADSKAKAQATQALRALIAQKSDGGYKALNWQNFFAKVQKLVEQGADLSITAGKKGDTIMQRCRRYQHSFYNNLYQG